MAGRILIADCVATNRIILKVKLASACYDVLQASSGREVLHAMVTQAPELVILDRALADMDAIEVIRQAKADPRMRHIPIIVMAGRPDPQAKIDALDAGADEFLAKALDEPTLLARVRCLLRSGAASEELRRRETTAQDMGFAEAAPGFQRPGSIALVARDRETAIGWRTALAGIVRDRLTVIATADVLGTLGEAPPPDVFLIECDPDQPAAGLRLLTELRSRAETRHAGILVMHAERDQNGAIMALDLGANDLVQWGADARELASRLRTQLHRKIEADRLRTVVDDGLRLAALDPLTGLYNRRYAVSHLARIAELAVQTGRSFAVMILDLDRFKSINDAFGHPGGDTVLVEVARRIRENLRNVDLVARMGGEEFLVAMPDTALPAARAAAERIRAVIGTTPVRLPDGRVIPVTASIGVAIGGGHTGKRLTIESLIGDADRALYGAKTDGRNQVTVSRSAA